ncbi:lipoprotein [Spiroplasma alleghenense]|uniref:Lipoprotein n=1 Tax=Spiroplasma alleghenense TaxID=216931 RepID=A0A345Z2J4_9MOLU|nr:lipoprotein [Spiroplasma alleghenense]AXK50823.1 hypothetical protein SALLE_v1c01470 [Spiroplasma alleghenense]
MKKLLSILASTAMVITIPTSVVSCKKNRINPENEFDYRALQLELKNSVQQIFESNLKSDFDNYFFVSESNGGDNGVDYPFDNSKLWIIENKEAIEKLETPESKEIQNNINQIISWENVEAEINSKIMTDVNFKPVLVNGKSPLADGYFIDAIEIKEQGEDGPISLYINIGANFYFLNSNGEVEVETLNNFKTSITITCDETDADSLNKVKNIYTDTLNTQENANSFIYRSDKGNLQNTADAIREKAPDNSVYNQFESILNFIDFEDKEITFNKEYIISPVYENIIDSSVDSGNSKFRLQGGNVSYGVGTPTLKKAVRGDKEAEEKFISEVSKNGSTFYINNVKYKVENIEEMSAKYEDFSEVINSFNLEYNLKNNSAFKNSIENSNFKLNPEEERNYIALFRASIKGITFSLNGFEYDLPEEQIIIKQLPESENTKVLYKKFVQDAFDFIKTFFGFSQEWSIEDNWDYFYYLKKPESWKDIEPTTPISTSYGLDQLFEANPEATKYLETLDLTIGVSFAEKQFYRPLKWISFNENNDIYFYNNLTDNIWPAKLRVWYFSSALTSNDLNNKNDFYFGERYDYRMIKVNESISPYKFKN